MKTAEPETIYLQIGDDADITEFKKDDFQTNSISWCWERIFPNDIEYVTKQSIIELIDEMYKAIEEYPFNEYNSGYKCALNELKQKIEAL